MIVEVMTAQGMVAEVAGADIAKVVLLRGVGGMGFAGFPVL